MRERGHTVLLNVRVSQVTRWNPSQAPGALMPWALGLVAGSARQDEEAERGAGRLQARLGGQPEQAPVSTAAGVPPCACSRSNAARAASQWPSRASAAA